MSDDDFNNDCDRTEPQRKALEEMSQTLLDNFNKMIEQQEARAQEFARISHSLSSLPQQVAMPEHVELPPVAPPRAAPGKVVAAHTPPLVRQSTSPVPDTPPHRQAQASKPRPNPSQQTQSEGSFSGIMLVAVGVGIFLLLRSCS